MADTVKFLQSTQDSVKAEVSVVEPAQLEAKMKEVKHNIEVRMQLVLQEIRKQEEKYADMTDMPTGTTLQNLSHTNMLYITLILVLNCIYFIQLDVVLKGLRMYVFITDKINTATYYSLIFTDLTEQVEVLKSMEDAVAKELEEASKGLSQAKEAKVTFGTSLQRVQEWLTTAEQQLEEEVTDLKDGQEKHKAFLAEMKEHAPEIELLRAQAKELVQKPSSPEDKEQVLESLANITSQWQEVQKMADQKSK